MDQEQLKEDVVKAIRGLLISSKAKTSLRQLERDYRTVLGDRIPYGRLGFRNLEQFISSVPTLVLSEMNGELFVVPKVLQQSAHIAEMVHYQKADKKKNPKTLRFPPKYAPKFSKPAPATSNWRPNHTSSPRKHYQTSSRPAAVSHNQFLSYHRPSVPSKVVIPEHSTIKAEHSTIKAEHSTIKAEHSTINGPTQNVMAVRGNRTAHRTEHQGGKMAQSEPVVITPDRSVYVNGSSMTIQTNVSNSSSTKHSESNNSSEGCSVLSHTKKRITRMMSEISVVKDRDSGNSSPTDESNVTASASIIGGLGMVSNALQLPLSTRGIEYIQTGDPIIDLKKFAELYKLGDVEISTNLIKTKQNRLHTCKIKVGSKIYTSYPKEFSNEWEAKKYCASAAFNDLHSKHDRRKCLLVSSDTDILNRIPPLLEKHNHGIWNWQLQLDYADMYSEQLPSDWLKTIDSSPCIQIEKCSDNYVLRHCKPEDKNRSWSTFKTLSDVSVPSNTVQFQEDGKLFAEVTCVMSANEIWCRQCSTPESDAFNRMVEQMEEFYSTHKDSLRAEKINAAGYYVTEFESQWYRVRAVAVGESDVSCFFIDYGDEMFVPNDSIFKLKREFAKSQAQAFVCRLVGLEELYEISHTSEVLQSISYTQVILELSRENVGIDENDLSLPIFMYNFETGKSINEELIHLLTIESALPVIQKETITEVFVSHIESNGDVYVQVRSQGFLKLQSHLTDLEALVITDPPTHLISPITKQNSEGKLYFGKCKADGSWCRIQAIDWSPKEELAQIYFVDIGSTDVINVTEEVLYPLEKLSDILSQYPAQAVKVKMAVDEIPDDFLTLSKKAMPEDQAVLMKIIGENVENIPLAEFFRRNSDGGLFCINKSISMEAEIKKGDGNNNMKNSKRTFQHLDGALKNVPSGGKLSPPIIPAKGELFEVHVPFAVNPYNFFVQPLESRQKLHRMMERLQERYKDVLYSPLLVDQIVPGNIYASKFEDGNWYRTNVLKVIHSGSISVFYCDYGYYGSLTVQQLIPLDFEFLELPYQALKAKLCDVVPKNSKWTMEDCDHFKELVEKKNFYSWLIDIEKDQLYESDLVLKLRLIDTRYIFSLYLKFVIREYYLLFSMQNRFPFHICYRYIYTR
ncbi:unnamed protein product [Phaedon cochleariae]|uniref:Tudor domain-containing protein 7 n=1 Tax=Phaedon cochleariae TaxID=80249 RepID=A0A9N9SIH4_PHACE|nr:unnamed protein product [Phaedon cochleariae]